MNPKTLLISFALTKSLAARSPVFSQQAPPSSDKAKQVMALVNKAAVLIDKDGKSAVTEFRKKDSEWVVPRRHILVRLLLVRLRFDGERIAQSCFSAAGRNERDWSEGRQREATS